ncbi:MAG: orotate phosphoribosyltransferase [Thermotogota bacterium]
MQKIMDMLINSEAILEGHFKLSSGNHSDKYVQCASVLKNPKNAEILGQEIAKKLPNDIELVVSPAMGGVIIGHEVAKALGVDFIFTERHENGEMILKRNFDIEKNTKIAIIEDVITTGKSTREVIELVDKKDGIIKSLGCIVNRGEIEEIKDIGVEYLLKINPKIYKPEECPLCKENVEITKPGSRNI